MPSSSALMTCFSSGANFAMASNWRRRSPSGPRSSAPKINTLARTRGLWWGCGGWTTRSYAKPVNALSPTLWPCGNKQVERFFKLSDLIFFLLEISISSCRYWAMNESQRQRLKLMAERCSEWLEAINYSPKTRVNYTRDVKLFLAWLSENTSINSIVDVTPKIQHSTLTFTTLNH